MNSNLGIPSYRILPVNASQLPEPSGSQAEHSHPNALSPARLSLNTQFALKQIEAQPNGPDQLLALLVCNGIADGALQIQSSQGAEAHYKQEVDAPSARGTMGARQVGNLTVRAKLNEQSQYDIIGINFHVPSSGATASINLPDSPPAVTSNNEPSGMCGDQQFSHLAALSSRSQFTQASIGRSNSQDVSRKPVQAGHFAPSPTSLASLLPSQSSTSSVSKVRQGQIPDPEYPGKMTTQVTLNKRRYDRQRVPDPDNPGKTISRNLSNKRGHVARRVEDPRNSGEMNPNALNKRSTVEAPKKFGPDDDPKRAG